MTTLPDAVVAAARERRFLLGVVGVPGSGKSTLAAALAAGAPADLHARVVPMDGFHLSGASLAERGLADRKGAPETFDGAAFAALLGRLRLEDGVVMAPAYSRALHEPVADACEVPAECRLVVVEGNYLELWPEVRALLDEVWFLEVPWAVARERLIARHVAGGRTVADAAAWVDRVDAANAVLVEGARGEQRSVPSGEPGASAKTRE